MINDKLIEAELESKIAGLSAKIKVHSKNITSILEEAMKSPTLKKSYWASVAKRIEKEYVALDKLYTAWAKIEIPVAYRTNVKAIMTELGKQKSIAKLAKKSYAQMALAPKANLIVDSLYLNAIEDWRQALLMGKSNLLKLTRKTRQALIAEKAINKTVFESIAEGNLMNNTRIKTIGSLGNILNEMAEVINGEKYVIAGSRRYRPDYYAEMVTRVKFHEAQAAGAMQTALNYGTSLVQVSAHNTSTPVCLDYEGKVFSINGKDPRFPFLDQAPPFHVNCLHNLFPMFESGMKADGTLKGWQDFSNGVAKRPPGNTAFVPVSLRKVS